jgi:hypothetical protein
MLEQQHSTKVSSTPKGALVTPKLNTQPVLNGKYALLNRLGEGNTSKVYLA